MKTLLCLFLSLFSFSSFSMDADEANLLIEMNQKTFSDKKLLHDPDLCEFQNDLIEQASKKYKHKNLSCSRRKESIPTTNEDGLNAQLQNISNSMAVIDVQHQESYELSQEGISQYAKQKIKSQGFGN